MIRRNFLKQLAVSAAAAVMIPKLLLEPESFKKAEWVKNPKWETAKYRMEFYDAPMWVDQSILEGQ